MHVAQTGEVGFLVGEPGFPILKPNLAAGRAVPAVDLRCRLGMKFVKKPSQSGGVRRRKSNKVVVI
jgi:hypothetical protein